MLEHLKQTDHEIYEAIRGEEIRQETQLEMIASENIVSEAVLEAAGTWLTNKYAEGYPGKRYYGGCEHVDIAEKLAIERAKKIFGADHANVQPHSGAQANTAVFFALLNPGDTIMGMDLAHGGHLTHGFRLNLSGKWFKNVPYGLNPETEHIDYDALRKLALEHRPKLLIAGASAYPRKIDFQKFADIAKEAGSLFMVDMAHIAGLVAAKLHPDPIPLADVVTTTTHKTLRGPRGGMILCKEKHAKAIDSAIIPGTQGGPLMHIIAAKAVAFKEALEPSFAVYQKQIIDNAQALAKVLTGRGFRLVSGGTDNHLMLVDLRSKNINGKQASDVLDKAGITVNKNQIPNDPLPPLKSSGIRVGTPALTTRGMKVKEMEQIGDIMDRALSKPEDAALMVQLRKETLALAEAFPVYPNIYKSLKQ